MKKLFVPRSVKNNATTLAGHQIFSLQSLVVLDAMLRVLLIRQYNRHLPSGPATAS